MDNFDDIEEDLNFNDKLLDRDNNFEEIFDAFYYNKTIKPALLMKVYLQLLPKAPKKTTI